MPKARIDQALLATAKCPPGRSKLDTYDVEVKGFIYELRASGEGTYYLRYTDVSGRKRQHKIGGASDISCAAARKAAQRLRSEVVLGGDPAAAKAEARATPTFAEIAEQHITYARLHLRSYDDVESIHRIHLLPKFGKKRVTEITRPAVSQFLAEKRASGLAPVTVEKIRVIMGRCYQLAAQEGVPGCDKNPCRGIKRPQLVFARERFLTAEEAARLKAAAASSRNTQLKPIVELLLLTGARKRELLDAKWEHVDLGRRQWLIPTSKTGRPRRVPISQAAVDVIEALPRFDGCPWLIPNPATREPYTCLKSAWREAIKKAKLPGLRIHDLRHSAASFMCAAGVPLYSVGTVLGHANVSTTAKYAHLSSKSLLEAVEAGAAMHRTT
jgi:integrase